MNQASPGGQTKAWRGIGVLVYLLPSLLTSLHAQEGAGPFKTQVIQLEAGWNAVYVEIEPLEGAPNDVFAGTPIEMAAAYFRPTTAMEFIESPQVVLPDRKGWNLWYAPSREDALLTDLHAIQAHQSYLIYTPRAYSWSLRGTPYFADTRWHPEAFSLVGFPVDAAEQPTVAAYFSGAALQTPLKIYRMSGGQWSLITNPAQTMMKPGAAYWAYSKGASAFSGPFEVDFEGSSAGGMTFTATSGARRMTLKNVASYPQTYTLTLTAGNNGLLPMAFKVQVLDGPTRPVETISVPLKPPLVLGPLEPGLSFLMDLEVLQEGVNQPVVSSTLTITSSAGQKVDLPLVSLRKELLTNP